MKKIRITISTVCLVILMGCQTQSPKETEVSILFDITNSTQNTEIDILTSDIVKIFELQQHLYNYGTFRISSLSETHMSAIKQVALLPIVSKNDYNKYVRENKINIFKVGVDSLLTAVQQSETGKQASSLFIPISRELHRLTRSHASNKILLCYTDLLENSSTVFSVYSKETLKTLEQSPEQLTERLVQSAPLPENLQGITIYIIYTPMRDTDETFLAISQWYKALLESKGAKVLIGANFVLNDLIEK